jgi:hypothetical protein
MIAMQVTDKNVIDAMQVGLKLHELHLRALTTVNQKMAVLDFHQLGGGKPSVRGQRTARTQYRDLETQSARLFNINKKETYHLDTSPIAFQQILY